MQHRGVEIERNAEHPPDRIPAGAGRARRAVLAQRCRPSDRCYGPAGRGARFRRTRRPSLAHMTAETVHRCLPGGVGPCASPADATASAGSPADAAERPAGALAVAVAGGRLQDLPAAVPLPHHRPAARAAHRPTRSAAPWCTPCWSGCSTCRPAERTPAGRGRPGGARSGSGWSSRAARAGRRRSRRRPRAGRPPRRPSSSTRRAALLAGYFAVEDPRRLRARRAGEPDLRGGRRPAADPRLHRPARRRPGRRAAGGRLQDRRRAARGVRGAGAVPAQVLRAGAVAHPRRGAPGAAAALPQGRRGLRLRARRRGAGALRAHAAGAVAGDRAGRRRPATSAPSRAGCAAGAATRRSARRSAALRRRSPSARSGRRPPSRLSPPTRRPEPVRSSGSGRGTPCRPRSPARARTGDRRGRRRTTGSGSCRPPAPPAARWRPRQARG